MVLKTARQKYKDINVFLLSEDYDSGFEKQPLESMKEPPAQVIPTKIKARLRA